MKPLTPAENLRAVIAEHRAAIAANVTARGQVDAFVAALGRAVDDLAAYPSRLGPSQANGLLTRHTEAWCDLTHDEALSRGNLAAVQALMEERIEDILRLHPADEAAFAIRGETMRLTTETASLDARAAGLVSPVDFPDVPPGVTRDEAAFAHGRLLKSGRESERVQRIIAADTAHREGRQQRREAIRSGARYTARVLEHRLRSERDQLVRTLATPGSPLHIPSADAARAMKVVVPSSPAAAGGEGGPAGPGIGPTVTAAAPVRTAAASTRISGALTIARRAAAGAATGMLGAHATQGTSAARAQRAADARRPPVTGKAAEVGAGSGAIRIGPDGRLIVDWSGVGSRQAEPPVRESRRPAAPRPAVAPDGRAYRAELVRGGRLQPAVMVAAGQRLTLWTRRAQAQSHRAEQSSVRLVAARLRGEAAAAAAADSPGSTVTPAAPWRPRGAVAPSDLSPAPGLG